MNVVFWIESTSPAYLHMVWDGKISDALMVWCQESLWTPSPPHPPTPNQRHTHTLSLYLSISLSLSLSLSPSLSPSPLYLSLSLSLSLPVKTSVAPLVLSHPYNRIMEAKRQTYENKESTTINRCCISEVEIVTPHEQIRMGTIIHIQRRRKPSTHSYLCRATRAMRSETLPLLVWWEKVTTMADVSEFDCSIRAKCRNHLLSHTPSLKPFVPNNHKRQPWS